MNTEATYPMKPNATNSCTSNGKSIRNFVRNNAVIVSRKRKVN